MIKSRSFGIVGVVTLIAIALTALSPVRGFENFLADIRLSHHPLPQEHHPRITIIAIDDEALEDFPFTSPINRSLLAAVVEKLDKSGASVVALDIILDRPTTQADDSLLAAAIETARAPLILAHDPGPEAREALCAGQAPDGFPETILETFADGARLGHAVQCVDTLDEVVRTAPIGISRDLPGLAEAALIAAGHSAPDTDPKLAIPYVPGSEGPWPFATFSAAHIDVLPSAWFADRIVLVGSIAPYSGDFKTTPLRFADTEGAQDWAEDVLPGQLPGVVVHAYTLAGLLDGERAPRTPLVLLFGLCLLSSLVGVAVVALRWPLMATLPALLGLVFLYFWMVFQLFNWSGGNWMLPFSGPMAGLLIAAGIGFADQERRERSRRKMIHQSFAQFLTEERVNQIVKSPDLLSLNAEARDVTILFTDLEGFTQLVDTVDPERLAPALNAYLDCVIETLVAHGGAVDKIVGDAVHTMFSAPIADPEHKLNAVKAALAVVDVTERFRQDLATTGIGLGRTRIGISSGEALVGNFGSSKRFDYTAHGSVVNLAARLEAANKTFGTSVCLSADAKVESEHVDYRTIGELDVKGLAKPVQVLEAVRAGTVPGEALSAYQRSLGLLHRDPARAVDGFKSLLAASPDDRLVAYQLRQVEAKLAGE